MKFSKLKCGSRTVGCVSDVFTVDNAVISMTTREGVSRVTGCC